MPQFYNLKVMNFQGYNCEFLKFSYGIPLVEIKLPHEVSPKICTSISSPHPKKVSDCYY